MLKRGLEAVLVCDMGSAIQGATQKDHGPNDANPTLTGELVCPIFELLMGS
jgi:hypothetical protein